MNENFPGLRVDIKPQIQKVQRTPWSIDIKSLYTGIAYLVCGKPKKKRKSSMKPQKGNTLSLDQRIRISLDFSFKNHASKKRMEIFEVLKEIQNCIPSKFFKSEDNEKDFLDPLPPIKGITSRPALQEKLNSSGKSKAIQTRHLDLHKEKTNIQKGINKSILKSWIIK